MSDVVKEIASLDAQFKVIIRRRKDGLYEVASFKWTREVVPDYGEVGAFWESVSRPSLTDTLSNAETLADEELLAWSGMKS